MFHVYGLMINVCKTNQQFLYRLFTMVTPEILNTRINVNIPVIFSFL